MDGETVSLFIDDALMEAVAEAASDFEVEVKEVLLAGVKFLMAQGPGVISGALYDAETTQEDEDILDFN